MKTPLSALAVLVAILSLASNARAQDADAGVPSDGGASVDAGPSSDAGDAGPIPMGMVPPELLQFVEAEYPVALREAGTEANVILSITINSDGSVRASSVAQSSGYPEFDAAAVTASQRFVFRPATNNGVPVAARIQYRYVFELHEEPQPLPVEPTPSPSTDLDAGVPLSTDAGIDAASDSDAGTQEEIPAEPAEELTFGAVARVEPPAREVTRRTIESEEMVRIPGTRGDALRSIELLPGVARPPGLAGLVIIRGSAPGDSQVMLESTPVPLLYHFGGLTSFYNSRLIDRIDFYPGNFSVRYGRKLGGIIDVGVRDPRTDRFHGVVDLNLIDSSVMIEAPITDNLSVSLAARRSYIDFFFDKLIPSDAFVTLAAPVYYDYQGILSWRPTERDRVRVMGYASADRFSLILPPAESDPSIRGNLDLRTSFYRIQADWRHRYGDWLQQDIAVSVGGTDLRFGLGDQFTFNLHTIPIVSRAEWNARLSRSFRLIGGLDIITSPTSLSYFGPAVGQSEGNPEMGANQQAQARFNTALSRTVYRPAVFLEALVRPIDPLSVVAGVRLDYYDEIESWSFDPRLSARYTLDEHWTIKAGVGRFSQPPEFQESMPGLGNPNVTPVHALHVSAGVDHQFNETFSLGVEGFYKWINNRVVSTQNSEPPFYENAGVGRIYGLEIAGRARPTGRFFGFLSYTLSRSERRDHPDQAWRLFDFDQSHILTLSMVYKLGRGWELGGTFRLVSGNPLTPVIGSVYDVTSDIYQPIYGAVNSQRAGLFHRLDVRLEKMWRFTHWNLAFYIDIQNIYSRMNPEGTLYNYDYRESQVVGGLPIIPSIGLRGEL